MRPWYYRASLLGAVVLSMAACATPVLETNATRSIPPPEIGETRSVIDWTAGEVEWAMPHYEFLCETCKKPFEVSMTISEREKAKPKCPTCKGTKVVPQFGGFMAQTSKKS